VPIIIDPSGYTSWAQMISEAVAYVTGCPSFMVEDKVKSAAREFLERSNVWRSRKVEFLTTVAAQASYGFDLPANARLNNIHVAYRDGVEVDVQLAGEEDDTDTDATADTWKLGVEPSGYSIRVTPTPSVAGAVVTGTVSYVTSLDASGIPDWIYDRWHEDIAAGAAGKLLLQITRPWANPQMAGPLLSKFEEGILEASNFGGPVKRRSLRVQAR
jgi:hypothetical protein